MRVKGIRPVGSSSWIKIIIIMPIWHLFEILGFNMVTHHHFIIMSRHKLGYSWPSLATPPYRTLLSTDPQGYIPYWHRAAVCRFELVVLLLLVHVRGSTGVHHLWARPYFFSSLPRVCETPPPKKKENTKVNVK